MTAQLIEQCRGLLKQGAPPPEIFAIWSRIKPSVGTRGIRNRLNLEKVGIIDLGIEIIRADVSADASISAWSMLQTFVLTDDVDDPLEKKTGLIFAEKGCFELAAKELSRTDRDWSEQIYLNMACKFILR